MPKPGELRAPPPYWRTRQTSRSEFRRSPWPERRPGLSGLGEPLVYLGTRASLRGLGLPRAPRGQPTPCFSGTRCLWPCLTLPLPTPRPCSPHTRPHTVSGGHPVSAGGLEATRRARSSHESVLPSPRAALRASPPGAVGRGHELRGSPGKAAPGLLPLRADLTAAEARGRGAHSTCAGGRRSQDGPVSPPRGSRPGGGRSGPWGRGLTSVSGKPP